MGAMMKISRAYVFHCLAQPQASHKSYRDFMKIMGKDRIMNWSEKHCSVLQVPNTFWKILNSYYVKDWSTCCSYKPHDANHIAPRAFLKNDFHVLGFENLWGGLFLVLFLLHRWTVCTLAWVFSSSNHFQSRKNEASDIFSQLGVAEDLAWSLEVSLGSGLVDWWGGRIS